MRRFRFEGKDKRGAVWSFRLSEDPLEEFIIIYTKKGAKRGGHYHSNKEYHLILKGEIEFLEKDKKTLRRIRAKKGDFILTIGKIPHLVTALSDSWMIEWHELPKTTHIYRAYRKIVDKSKE